MVHVGERLRILGPWQELVDVLVDVDLEEGALVFSRCMVSVPFEVITKSPQLTSLIGMRIRLLRTDLPDRQFIVTVPKHVTPRQADVHLDPERDRDNSEIHVNGVDLNPFQTLMEFDEKNDEHAEPEESHPGIITEISDEKRRRVAKQRMLHSVLQPEEGRR